MIALVPALEMLPVIEPLLLRVLELLTVPAIVAATALVKAPELVTPLEMEPLFVKVAFEPELVTPWEMELLFVKSLELSTAPITLPLLVNEFELLMLPEMVAVLALLML